MTLRLRIVVLTAASLGSACVGAKAKPGDSTAVAPDSAASTQSAPPPAPPTTDSTVKSAQTPPPPSGSNPTSTPAPQPTPTPSETVLTGKISVGGLSGQEITSLVIEGAKPARLIGPLEPELQRLNSATVWVAGGPVASPAGGFMVTRYDIVSIDGAKPLVGTTVSRNGALWLATVVDTVKLTAAPSDLTSKVGAKVWVVGRRSGNDLVVQSFGIIRDP